MPRPAILQLISSSGFYGAERVLLELALHLRDQGWPVEVAALQAPGMGRVALLERARERGLPVLAFPCRGGFDARAMAHLRRYVRDRGVGLVHSHGYKSNIYAFLALGERGPLLVSTCHNWLTDSLKLMLYELCDKLVLHRFHHVVGVSPPLAHEIRAAGIQRCSVIDNGLDLEASLEPGEREELRRSLGVEPEQTLLLAIGRLDPWKAYDRLLQAMARIAAKQTRLVLVGEGDLRGELEQQARELGVAHRVTFAGYRHDVGRLLLASDLFVISSRKEGLPMVLLEAMAAGLPVVSTRVGAIPEALVHGEHGLLVAPEDADALAGALDTLTADVDRRRTMGQAAKKRHGVRHSRRAMGQRYEALYRSLLKGAR